jgi:hypothetical protein
MIGMSPATVTRSGGGVPVDIEIIISCKIGYKLGFAEIKHQTETCHLLARRKIQTYSYIRHVGCILPIPLRSGLLIRFITGFEGRLELRLQFQKQ